MTPLGLALLIVSLHLQKPARPRAECQAWQECRQLALDAATREDFEVFHDLAWRAVQTGPRNDPALLYLLARAQSLSGRPGDALVMLQRLAQMGVPTDAATNDDFRRVRALPRWGETDASRANGSAPSKPVDTLSLIASRPADTTRPAEISTRDKPVAPSRNSVPLARATPSESAPGESLRFTTLPFTPAGLAYDAVSRRFIVGDRLARKLSVVDEFSRHVANLVGAQATGFGDIAALEIDPHQGNLWVVTAAEPGTTLHKLQLVSGRALASYTPSGRFGETRFADVAATADSTILVLDSAGHRLFRLRAREQQLELAATLPDKHATSIAPATETLAYVAQDGGIVCADLESRAVTPLKLPAGMDLAGVVRVRWHKGALVAIQRAGSGPSRAIRVTLDRSGRTATGLQVLDPSLLTTDPTAATVSGGVLYYLASGDGHVFIVRRVALP